MSKSLVFCAIALGVAATAAHAESFASAATALQPLHLASPTPPAAARTAPRLRSAGGDSFLHLATPPLRDAGGTRDSLRPAPGLIRVNFIPAAEAAGNIADEAAGGAEAERDPALMLVVGLGLGCFVIRRRLARRGWAAA